MVDVTYEDYQDLVRKLSLANERIRDLQERVSGRDARIAALEAQLAEPMVTDAMELARAVLAQSFRTRLDGPGPTPADIEKAFWALDAALKTVQVKPVAHVMVR